MIRHLSIRGRVQGVGFRFFVQREAEKRGVTGWVRNRADGSVEAMLQGPDDEVEAVIESSRRGPRSANVIEMQVSEGTGSYSAFEVRPTA